MTTIDKTQFGPWALITGASSGIGREFARQIAASGINVVLVARREALLEELGRAVANEFGVKSRTVVADLSQVDFLDHLAQLTDDLDIGLVVSNAGTPHPGAFLKIDRSELEKGLRLNTLAHLDIAHHFGQRLAKLGLTTDTMPMKPMKAEQCVSEGLKAIQENRSMIIPGRMNRIMNAVVPASVTRTMEAKMLSKALANKSTAPQTHADVR